MNLDERLARLVWGDTIKDFKIIEGDMFYTDIKTEIPYCLERFTCSLDALFESVVPLVEKKYKKPIKISFEIFKNEIACIIKPYAGPRITTFAAKDRYADALAKACEEALR